MVKHLRLLFALLAVLSLASAACTSEVVKEIEVPGETVVVEKEVVKEVPVEKIVVVEKEVVKEVPVEKIVVVEKEVVRLVGPGGEPVEKHLRVRNSSHCTVCDIMVGGSGATKFVWQLMASGLYEPDAVNQEWVPLLAERWDWAPSGDSITFYLRKNAFWHDGEPVTADDVAYSYQIQMTPDAKSRYFVAPLLQAIKGGQQFFDSGGQGDVPGIVVIDDYAIRFDFPAPNAVWFESTGWFAPPIFPEHILGKIPPTELGKSSYWSESLIGSGPFRFSSQVPDQSMEFVANDDYFLGRPNIDRITVKIIPSRDTAMISALRGEIDWLKRGGFTPEQYQIFMQDPRFELYKIEATNTSGFAFNLRNPLVSDKRVREAFLYALDRQRLIDVFRPGRAIVTNVYAPGYQKPEWKDMYGYDPAKARELLEQANWDFNQVLTIEARSTEDQTARTQMAAEKQFLEQAGFKVELREGSGAEFTERYEAGDFAVARVGGFIAAPASIRNYMLPPQDNTGIGELYPELVDLINETFATVDRERRWELYEGLNAFVLDKIPVAYTMATSDVVPKAKRFRMPVFDRYLEGVSITSMADIPGIPFFFNRHDAQHFHPERWDIDLSR